MVPTKTVEEQFVDFLQSTKDRMVATTWIHGSTIEVYVRKEIKRGRSCLTIANWQSYNQFEDADEEILKKFILLAHYLNPYDYTFVETAPKSLGQWLWENDWEKDTQAACMIKKKNHGQVPWELWMENL